MGTEKTQTTAYDQTQHSYAWIRRAEDRKQNEDFQKSTKGKSPEELIGALMARVSELEAWQKSFRIAGPRVEGSGAVWAFHDPQIRVTGVGTVTCDGTTGVATIDLALQTTLE